MATTTASRAGGTRRIGLALALTGVGAMLLFLYRTLGPEAAFFLAPLFLLVAPLIGGRYVGEQAIERLAGRRAAPSTRRIRQRARLRRPSFDVPARTGWLLAFALAMRPPPARLISS